jgi:uncharacterized membrane protein
LETIMSPLKTGAATLLGAFALSAIAAAAANAQPVAQPAGSEKCYGVAKAAKNDCAAGAHSCAGQATKEMDKASFVYLPKGACAKIAGGTLKAM